MSNKYTIQDCVEIANSRGGACLSDSYSSEKLKWKCGQGHVWEAKMYHIKSGTWCPDCSHSKSGKHNKMTIETVSRKLDSLGFKFVSTEYNTANEKYILKCNAGHIFADKLLRHILAGKSGCPECNNFFKSEKIFRNRIEKILGFSFPKARPKWLINPNTNRLLELDCYNEELKLAFEYDGQFHFEVRPGLNNNLEKTKELDSIKNKLCIENGVTLIRVSYFLKEQDFYNKIIDALKAIYGADYWMIVREVEGGSLCPVEVKQARAAARARVVR